MSTYRPPAISQEFSPEVVPSLSYSASFLNRPSPGGRAPRWAVLRHPAPDSGSRATTTANSFKRGGNCLHAEMRFPG